MLVQVVGQRGNDVLQEPGELVETNLGRGGGGRGERGRGEGGGG